MRLRLGFFYVGLGVGLLVVPLYGSCYGYFGEVRVEV